MATRTVGRARGKGLGGAAATQLERFASFDGLRALAALAIVVTHAAPMTGWDTNTGRGPWLVELNIGVGLFFVISGFLLYRPFVFARFAGGAVPGTRSYLVRRAMRIYPAYWVALAVGVYVLGTLKMGGGGNAILHFGLVQSYKGAVFDGITQAWTLCVEITFYAFLPLYAFVMARTGRTRRLETELIGLGVLTTFGVATNFWQVLGRPPTWVAVLPENLLLFAPGMLFAVISAWIATRPERTEPSLWDRLGEWSAAWWMVAAAGYVFLVAGLGLHARENTTSSQTIARLFLEAAISGALVFPAVFGGRHRDLVRRFLQHRVLVFLGVISYGIYIWHLTIMTIVHDDWFGWQGRQGSFVLTVLVTTVVTIAVASASWYLLEKPLINLSRRLSRQRRVAVPSRPEPEQGEAAPAALPVRVGDR